MPTMAERSLIKFGDGGLAISIPIGWARFYGLKPKDKLMMVVDHTIRIKPPRRKEKPLTEGAGCGREVGSGNRKA